MKDSVYKILLFLSGLVIFIFCCEEEKEIVDFKLPFEISHVNFPEVISSTSERMVLLTAMVTHPEGHEGIQKVEAIITDTTNQIQLTLQLYDDGSIEAGDVIAFDNIYTRSVVGNKLGLPDNSYNMKLQASSTNYETLESNVYNLKIYPNQAPEVLNYDFPDSILVGLAATNALFTVNDNDGLDDILWVIIQGFETGNSFPSFQDTVFNPLNNSPVFSYALDSTYAAGKKGDYEMKIFAEDKVGEISDIKTFQLFVENTPPQILSIWVPDTMIIPTTGFSIDTVRAHADDRQSITDIDSVYFISQMRNPNGTLGTPNPPIELFDNGDLSNFGDKLADDGEYSRIIRLDPSNTAGTYIFTFKARDLVDQVSNSLIDSINVKK